MTPRCLYLRGADDRKPYTAHKIARTVYHLLKNGEAYVAQSAGEYEEQRRERELRQLTRRAQKLGYTLAPAPPPSALPAA